jgi:hypothetical protein
VTGWPDWASFAQLVIVHFGKLLNYKLLKYPAFLLHAQVYELISTKNGLGYTLGDFFHELIWSPWTVASDEHQISAGPEITTA